MVDTTLPRLTCDDPQPHNRPDAIELVDYYNRLNNRSGWYYEIVEGCENENQCYILVTSPDIEQYDGTNIVGYL